MDQSAISVRYAKALFTLAKEKKLLPVLKNDIELVYAACKNSNDFVLLTKSPVVKTSKKIALFNSIFKGKVDDLTLRFLRLVTENKRENYIPAICRNFLALTRKDQNIKSAQLTTATEINVATKQKIEMLLEKKLNAKVELSGVVDPEIIGGLILRMDDKQYDASVSTQLKNIKQNLLKTDIN
ncbi:MAG TPA: ATP synthase F1 subunit delta [Prolixibacteraceae bacterium]|nr:ATP synthase F1 subunit delta [Prolixibacteraceae bacterium]